MHSERSPGFDQPKPRMPRITTGWIKRHRRSLWALLAVIVVVDLLVLAVFLSPGMHEEPGGLDGCVATTAGTPLQTTVQVGDQRRTTFADGCFFFAALPPGRHQLRIETATGAISAVAVTIKAGEASGLGVITVP